MDSNFERSPQDDENPFRGASGGQTGWLASLFSAQQQRTQLMTETVVTGLFGNPITTTVPLTRLTTDTLDNNSQDSTDSVNSITVSTSASTTFATTTPGTQQYGNSQTASQTAYTAQTESPTSYAQISDRDGGLSNGEIAAATIVPVVATLFIAMALLIHRKRSRARRDAPPPDGSVGKTSFFGVGFKEQWGSLRSSTSSQKEPVVTSHSNNTYMTGLDTSSRSGDSSQQNSGEYYATGRSDGGTSYMDAPPPYIIHPNSHGAPVIPALQLNLNDMNSSSHEMTQLSPTDHPLQHFQPSPLLTPASLDPPQSSARSARSINSDAYSDTASIHSARAARVSMGGPAMINPTNTSSSRISSLRGDPFGDSSSPPPSLPPVSRRPSDENDQSERRS